ncbi:unnamed protein product [Protopolystoma xenopodis]|uniref:Uncharacterized protein n=1 Tax=Protopolystoma xenopodis TaxID=117903 RepID=A0A448XC11_9PLAT|nr:unnamed protein product [Protopolystoma xenopodis]
MGFGMPILYPLFFRVCQASFTLRLDRVKFDGMGCVLFCCALLVHIISYFVLRRDGLDEAPSFQVTPFAVSQYHLVRADKEVFEE